MATVPVSQVADGSLPDANGWYKSNIVIESTPVESEEDKQSRPYYTESLEQFEKFGKECFPEGSKVSRASYGTAETIGDALHIGILSEDPDKGFTSAVQIDLYINVSSAEEAYKLLSEQSLAIDQESKGAENAIWTEWPRGFPNQNDYENVSHCGANKDNYTVVWIQNKTAVKLTKIGLPDYMKEMVPAEQWEKIVPADLKDFADGVWQAVNGMGL